MVRLALRLYNAFFTARDLRTIPKKIWNTLSADGEVVISNNGKPTALMINITDSNFDEVVRAVRQARAMIAFNSMRAKVAKQGYMSDVDLEAEIAEYRKEKKS